MKQAAALLCVVLLGAMTAEARGLKHTARRRRRSTFSVPHQLTPSHNVSPSRFVPPDEPGVIATPPADDLPIVSAPIPLPVPSSAGEAAEAVPLEPLPSDRPSRVHSSAAGSLDFDLLGPAEPTQDTPEAAAAAAALAAKATALEQQAKTRRVVLTVHQALGLATVATLIATDVVGQLNYSDLYGGGGGTRRYANLHMGLSLSATGLFATSGLLALFAPQPFVKHSSFDSSIVHRIFMAIATLGFLTEVGLGLFTASQSGKALQPALAQAHQIIGYTTLGAMSVGTVALFF